MDVGEHRAESRGVGVDVADDGGGHVGISKGVRASVRPESAGNISRAGADWRRSWRGSFSLISATAILTVHAIFVAGSVGWRARIMENFTAATADGGSRHGRMVAL
jgi:hypothetical protein